MSRCLPFKLRRPFLAMALLQQIAPYHKATCRALSSLSLQQQCSNNNNKNGNNGSLRVLLLRHGQTNANAAGIVQGSSDRSRLTASGQRQAADVASFLARQEHNTKWLRMPPDASVIYCSPLTRARETLEIILQQQEATCCSNSVTTLSNLREIDFYDWENRDKDFLQDNFPKSWQAWKLGNPHELIVYENATTVHYPLLELWQRADAVWDEILTGTDFLPNNHKGKTILIVAHGSLGQALLGTAMGWDATFFRKHEFPNCGMVEIQWDISEQIDRDSEATARPLASRWRWKWPVEEEETSWNTLEMTLQETIL